ncbi:MAG: DUF4391 domain-containing protein [Alloprevotella sp.]
MYGLPSSTHIDKQLFKKVIFEKYDFRPIQRNVFDADISRMDIMERISPSTLPGIEAGSEVKEFYVLAVQLKHKFYQEQTLSLLVKFIPQRMIFALHCEEQVQWAVFHTRLITSSWMPQTEATLHLQGLNLDSVWNNLVADIGNIAVRQGNTLTEQIQEDMAQAKLRKQLVSLQKQLNQERQFNKQIEINARIKAIKQQLR